jgi:hypothetical protein
MGTGPASGQITKVTGQVSADSPPQAGNTSTLPAHQSWTNFKPQAQRFCRYCWLGRTFRNDGHLHGPFPMRGWPS